MRLKTVPFVLAVPVVLAVLGCRAPEPTPPTLRLTLQPGDYIRVVAGQEHRDVVLTLSDASGRQLLKVDSLTAASAPPFPAEEVHWIADAPGELRIAMMPAGGAGPRLAEQRRATARDRQRVAAEAELARAHALRQTREPESCREGAGVYESAQRRFTDLGLPRRRAEALLGLGQLEVQCLRDDRAALGAFTRAEPLFSPEDPAYEARVRQHLGEIRFKLGDLDGAISDDRKALDLSRRTGEREIERVSASNLGYALHLRGRYDEAAALFEQALALPGDDRKRARVLINRGQLHRDLGQAERARQRFQEALGLFRKVKDQEGEAAALNALGGLALDSGRYGEALEPLRGALALSPPGSSRRAVTLTSLGVAYRGQGQLEEARRAYADALPLFQAAGDTRDAASCLGNLGRLEATAGREAAAFAHFDRALGLYRQLADPPDMAWVLEGKAWALRRRGDLEAARGLMEEALAAVERHRFSQTTFATRAAFFATRQGSYDFLIDLLMEQHRKAPGRGYDAAALEANERSLARSLLDGLAAGGADLHRVAAAPELHARERELEKEIDRLVSRQTRLAQEADGAALRSVEAELGRRWEELDRVRAGLRAADPRYAALTQPRPATAEAIRRELLDRDTLLLEYRLGEERSVLWAVTPDSLESFELPGRAAIERVARRAADLSARGFSQKAEVSARRPLAELSRLLLGPVARRLPGKRLLVVGDGILQSVPFAALPEPGSGEPLVAGHEIVSLPSVSVVGEIRRELAGRPQAPKTLWVLADPDFGSLPERRLPYTRDEAEAILGLVPASQRFALLGREARREAVLQGDLRDFRYLHFATHGSFAAGDPGGGRLVLADGFLHLADIYELDLRADLVVLSACESALGREVRGEGMMGMTRGFFYAGAGRLLVSLWNVDDRAAVELMRRFYQGVLVEGLAPAAALRAAQNGVRQQSRWRAPYYWAGFTLQGEWRPAAGPQTRR